MSSGTVTVSARLVAWLGAAALAALTAGAAGAIGTYQSVTEMRVELRGLAPRVDAIEASASTDGRLRDRTIRSIDRRLSRIEGALGVEKK